MAGDNGGPGKPGAEAPTGSVPSGWGHQEQGRRGTVGRLAAGTWTAASPATTVSKAPEGTTLETLAYVGQGSRWRIETSSRLRRVSWGWTNTRPAAGQGGITTSHVPAGWSVPAEPAPGSWGGKESPGSRGHRCTGPVRGDAAPGAVRAHRQLLLWLEDTQLRNERAAPFPRETPLHPPRKQDGAATLNPSLYVLEESRKRGDTVGEPQIVANGTFSSASVDSNKPCEPWVKRRL